MAFESAPELHVADLDITEPVPEGTVVVDVREQDEWDAGHVPDAVHIPMSELAQRVRELPEAPLLVICRSGGRSARAVSWLRQFGYDATNLGGGTLAWAERRLPVVRDDGAAGTVV
ncbi:MAG TPA: rhodanese-like domain-containing protein [Actinomycetaceae bacterium]|nr:rhodanese-like domain-containing protein [Actinomycetaceae bacterium]